MVNINGKIVSTKDAIISTSNRGFNYGDAVFETIRVSHGKMLFWEDHYFRLMASMRILRMEIPLNFTLEYLENQILSLIKENGFLDRTCRIKLLVFRDSSGYYFPKNKDVGYVMSCDTLDLEFYQFSDKKYVVDLYKDHYISDSLLSTIKNNNRIINVIGSIYASENEVNNCLLLNTNKHIVEALNANVFLVKDNVIKTPPLSDGCIKGVMRKQIIDIVKLLPELTLKEESISPFELQRANELFLTNVIKGIQPVTKYRKKEFDNKVANILLEKLNIKARLT